MKPVVERLTEKDYDETLYVLNEAFNHKEYIGKKTHEEDFEKNLPIMWTREHDYMSRHLAVRESGKIVSLLGIYPLPTVIAGESVLIGTIGNVGSLACARGKGYMNQLMTAALEEARKQGFVAARLGGLRSRYNRYGFDHAGTIYNFHLIRRNVNESGISEEMTFYSFSPEDEEIISFARKCQRRSAMYVIRETAKDFYYTLCAWQNRPLLVRNKVGEPIGYLSVSKDMTQIAEFGCIDGLTAMDLAVGYMNAFPELDEIVFQVMPFDQENLKSAFRYCESWNCESPSMFCVFQWDQLVYPMMKLAASSFGLANGELVFGIQDWGNLHIQVKNGTPLVEKVNQTPEFVLSHMEATNWLFGDVPVVRPLNGSRPEASWFPLLLSWNGQDRV